MAVTFRGSRPAAAQVDDCTKCEVDGECWQKLNDGSWGICLKNPFSR